MDYNYESLLDERFQMFCQALLVSAFPDVQCLPVGMPDGGRDATAGSGRDPIVFQVKFVRDPSKVGNPYNWLTKTIEGERKKIEELHARGSNRYILMTNMRGSSHLDSGAIDKIDRYLATLPIPGQCWWRDDLDRRLDNNFDLKLRYPSLLNGADAIRLLWSIACVGEGRERRQSALLAYFKHQHSLDEKIRFKQVDLSPTPLFDIFIDVPIRPNTKQITRSVSTRSALQRAIEHAVVARVRAESPDIGSVGVIIDPDFTGHDAILMTIGQGWTERTVGAAELLIGSNFSPHVLGTVLEGAPGQGKSTLAQFIAQVNRERIISEQINISNVPPLYSTSAIALPFKLELRDVAAWLNGKDPWSPERNATHAKSRSLEGALAGHIERYSGGVSFDVADLHFVLNSSPIILILDALDEVADLGDRRRVIDEIQLGITRLQSPTGRVKAIITSRPTAIAGAPAFSRTQFLHLTLGDIDRSLALDYTDRWSKARVLSPSDAAEVRGILDAKLDSPHMEELAKNTMQLSILLSLIYLRGSSLPDKRTELYDTYVDVFLNREAEKSKVIRENREPMINIHRYLAYYIHARAEATKSTGRLGYDELKALVLEYLVNFGLPVTLLDELIIGMVERFGALVSRVEGTYEFEVQPLREYFAARHLYNTAPYSPTGRVRTGTKPERFDGIAGNPYWLNVTRFFAGCFSQGELLDLADRLADIINAEPAIFLQYPRRLAISLLRDLVFTQSPKATTRLLNAIFDELGLRWAAASAIAQAEFGGDVRFELPDIAGAEELVSAIWRKMADVSNPAIRRELAELAKAQGNKGYTRNLWDKAIDALPASGLIRWHLIQIGWDLDFLKSIGYGKMMKLVGHADEPGQRSRLTILANGGAPVQELPLELLEETIRSILSWPRMMPSVESGSPLQIFSRFTSPALWITICNSENAFPYYISSTLDSSRRSQSAGALELQHQSGNSTLVNGVNSVVSMVVASIEVDKDPPITAIQRITDELHRHFEDLPVYFELGVISGAMKLYNPKMSSSARLMDNTVSVVSRIRDARKRSGHAPWWTRQLEEARSADEIFFWNLAVYAWASPRALNQLATAIESSISAMPDDRKYILRQACARARHYSIHARKQLDATIGTYFINNADDNIALLFFGRLPRELQQSLINGRFIEQINNQEIASVVLDFYIAEMLAGRGGDAKNLEIISRCYQTGVNYPIAETRRIVNRLKSLGRPEVEAVLSDAWNMPSELLLAAIDILESGPRPVRPVQVIADEGHWFDQPV